MLALFALFARLSPLQWCCGRAQHSLVFFKTKQKKDWRLGWEVGLGCWGLICAFHTLHSSVGME